MSIKCLKSGLIYRNPKPHVYSVHAYFPSVVLLNTGEMLSTFVLGEAFDAPNSHVNVAHSTDGGDTWRLEGPIYPGTPERLTSDTCRIAVMSDGEVVAFLIRHDRSRSGEGLTNPETLGFVPVELMSMRSCDGGRSWIGPDRFVPPLIGPAFEMTCPIIQLRDGRWILPTSTWRGWDGYCPNGMKMVAFVSYDRGKSWPEYMDVMKDPENRVIYWESKIVEFPDGRLLATAWAYDEAAAKDLTNQYAMSKDGGKTWSLPKSTGLIGQTLTPFVLENDRILCVYRRVDKPGLWANLSHFMGDKWVNDDCQGLWGTKPFGLQQTSKSMVENFIVLKFGAPCITSLKGGIIFVAFWCYEDCVSNIRWFKIQIN